MHQLEGIHMDRPELILTAMVPGGAHRYTPVQIQKLLFLIDRQIPQHVGGPHFHFEAYHYGPFDRTIYWELERLAAQGFVSIDQACAPRTFTLTPEGLSRGTILLNGLQEPIKDFIIRTCAFVVSQSFSSLVSAIYKAFPEMRENSVFQS
jgi:hypothetical protein